MRLDLKYNALLNGYHINTPLRIAHFMAQIEHESGLKLVRESLYYTTVKGLRDTFYTPFKGKTNLFVAQYLRNSEKCANYVYANRGGNGNEESGDGFKYRGGGYIQTTFKNGYLKLEKDTRIPFCANPDLILIEANSMISACEFWKNNKLNDLADTDNINSITKRINGGFNGLEDRKVKLAKWKLKLNL
jgi:putative chitinase